MAAAAANVCETTVGQDEYVETLAPKASMTSQRFVSPHSLEAIPLPNVPQALEVVNADHSRGMPEYETHGYSVLQQHVLFFDFDNDGIIYPWETFRGFQAVGFNLLVSLLAIAVINGAFSVILPWIPGFHHSCFLSKSRTFTRTSRGVTPKCMIPRAGFCPKSLRSCSVTLPKVTRLGYTLTSTNANMNAYNLFGWTAAKLEWLLAYLLVRDDNGFSMVPFSICPLLF